MRTVVRNDREAIRWRLQARQQAVMFVSLVRISGPWSRSNAQFPQAGDQVFLGPVALDPVAVGAEELQVVDVVLAAGVLGDDVINLQVAKLESGTPPAATALLQPEQDVLVLAIGDRRINVGAPWDVGARRYQTVVEQLSHRLLQAEVDQLYGLGRDVDPEPAAPQVIRRDASSGAAAEGVQHYENTAFFPQLAEVAEFARAVPDLTIVSNHICGLMRVGPYGDRDDEVIPAWREGVATLAQCPNVVVKLGGVGQPRYGFDWHLRETPIGSEELAEAMAPLMTYCIERFGPDRAMFESNFPPDKVSYSYNVMYNAFKRMTSGYSASERAAMLHDNAARVYSIDV